ncbi:DUF998 domain-containing protein [Brevibacterium sp. LS14]|uniref:DUF998 domain-containing protein n=1 Tax=Brevibacterium casei S18 TaxID=1229781 RepID=K9AT80_9MICO|nr:DUF998 domain-containing protein [Brevibacterium casei]EKU45817.1 hypothetical protein C272_13673 [Brevibacterium casei S18]MCT2358716.1 DUF998 domain-containing protein [Brevibacterium casei]NJE66963.1 DUF998 domain-containing protein [Brevibacterium sp. LS14]
MAFTLALLALVFGLARLGVFIALHLVPSEYTIVGHAVSDYAVGPTRRLSSAMTWLTAIFWALLAAAVALGVPDWSDATGITIALAALAVIFIVLPLAPTDLEGEKATMIGRIHYVLAIAWFAISYACMGNFTRLFTAEGPTWLAGALGVIAWIAAISLAVSVLVLIVKRLRPKVFGISERIFILAVSLFYLGVAAGLMMLTA